MRAKSKWNITNGSENNMKRLQSGFTLVELLVVFVIIIILITVIIAGVKDAKEKQIMTDDQYCKQEEISSRTINELPVRCLKYYETGVH